MNFPLVFAIFLGMGSHKIISASSDIYQRIQDDLKNMTETCTYKSTCVEARPTDTSSYYSCHCSEICTRLNTCCADSQHTNVKPPKLVPACRSVSDFSAYFMVDRCPDSSVWESMCHEDWNGEDNAMKLVPVTSLFTHITYKNYFCFRCHESGEDFLYWNVDLISEYVFDENIDKNTVSVRYHPTYRTWVSPIGRNGTWIPVNMTIFVPSEISNLPIFCERNVVSRCSDNWTDKDVSDKCEAYMGIVYIMKEDWNFIKYRNVHCALCNFEDLKNVSCGLGGGGGGAFAGKVPFSFTHLLDVNRSDGDEVGKVRKCDKDSLWDPYAKKCRALACALPGYVVRDGKCTPP